LAELAGIAVATVGDQHRRGKLPGLQLIEHVQHQLPLGPVPNPLGQLAGRPPLGHGGIVPALGQEQPPVERTRGLLGHGVDRHAKLAVGDLPERARVLALHPHRPAAVFGEAGVVHRPGDRVKGIYQAFGQAAADRPPVPRRHGHEVVQRLVMDLPAEPGGHRLD
jgi:hypothetical protein